ncbi:integrase [Haloferula luteola]|uniref:Integrase n=1 Tax=Haloferula luteola TaxID=595692 RepID=A0A840V9N1_9BACT|nr:site-specific integrase [Haloferula luteola]MBB5350660.1 integrase [Haloferula luteola]
MWNDHPVLYRGKYYAVSGSGNNKRRRSLSTTKLDMARSRLADLIAGSRKAPSLINEIFELYREHKEDSRDRLRYKWKVLEPYFGHLRPDQVSRKVCLAYREARQVGNGTIIRELGVLRAALRWHDPNTPAVFEFPASPPPRHRHLSREEVTKLIDACEQPHVRLYIVLALCTGARKGALLDLTWDRVDFDNELIDLGVGEGNKGRATVPINRTALETLKEARKGTLSNHVIEYQGKALKDIKRGFQTAVKAAGLKDVYPHALRHTAAVWMAEDGVPMSEIAQFLGHSSTRVTEKVYARYTPNYLRKAATSLELGAIAPFFRGDTGERNLRKPKVSMARVTGLEPAASAVTGTRERVHMRKSVSIEFNRHPFRTILK